MNDLNYSQRQGVVSKLETHFSRRWEFKALKTRNKIKFKWKEDKSNIKGKILLSENVIEYEVYDSTWRLIYLERTGPSDLPEKFLTAFVTYYPHNKRGDQSTFDQWLTQWMNDRRKKNKPYRQLVEEE